MLSKIDPLLNEAGKYGPMSVGPAATSLNCLLVVVSAGAFDSFDASAGALLLVLSGCLLDSVVDAGASDDFSSLAGTCFTLLRSKSVLLLPLNTCNVLISFKLALSSFTWISLTS